MATTESRPPAAKTFMSSFVALTGFRRLAVWTVWLSLILLPFNHVRVLSNHYFQSMFSGNFDQGWEWLNRPRDTSDFEWSILNKLFPFYIITCTIHSLILKSISMVGQDEHSKLVSITFSLVALIYPYHPLDFVIILGHLVTAYFVIRLKSRFILWAWVLAALVTMHFQPHLVIWLRSGQVDESKLLQLFSLLLCYLRILSFGLEYQTSSSNQKDHVHRGKDGLFGFHDFLAYILYPPLYLNGPILTYEKFKSAKVRVPVDFRKVIRNAVVTVFSVTLVEVGHHYLYSSSIANSHEILRKLNCIQTASVMWLELQYFYFKYLALYGAPAIFLALDGMESPGQPICITSLCTFSDMWRYFDKGLYSFLKKYIYVPVGGSRYGLITQLFASFCCFAFVSLWHGADWEFNVTWGITNWLGICLESLASQLYWMFHGPLNALPISGDRLAAFAGGVNIAFLVLSNCIFLDGLKAAKIYFHNLFIRGFPTCPIVLLFVLYCGAECILHCKKLRQGP